MRFENLGNGSSCVVATNRLCGAFVGLLGAAPLAWFGYAVAWGVLEPHHWVLLGCGTAVTLFGVAVFVHRQVVTFGRSGLRWAERKLWGSRVHDYETHQLRRLLLTRHVRGSHVTPFGFQARAVHYLVHVEFRGQDETFHVFHSMREERAHRVAHSAAANLGLVLRDEIGDEPFYFRPDESMVRHLDAVSLVHPPVSIGIDEFPGGSAVVIRGRTAPRRRLAAVLEWLLFGGITGVLGVLFFASTEAWWARLLLGVAITIAALPFLRVTAEALTRERIERCEDELVIERRVLGWRLFRAALPLADVLRVRMQTEDSTHHGLSLLTRTRVVRVGVSLRRDDLVWLRAWLEAQVPQPGQAAPPSRRVSAAYSS